MSNKQNFLKGAAVLVIANFIVKIIGVVYKIPLTNIIGGEGMGYFTSAYDIYLMLFSVSTAGLPVTLSRMVAESHSLGRYSEINKIVKVTCAVFVTAGLVGTLILFFGADILSGFISNSLVSYSLMALAPSLFFMSVMSVFRGYFQGLQNMNPTAISQVLEALTKLVVGVSLAFFAINLGLKNQYVSAYAIFGITISTVVSTIILFFMYFSKKNKQRILEFQQKGGECRTGAQIARDLIKFAIPITIGSLIVNLTGFLDLFLIMSRLQEIGYTEVDANFIYGSYKACAYTLFNLPPSIIASFNLTLIPVIATAYAQKDNKQLKSIVKKSVKITAIFSLPCAFAYIFFANPILNLMYPGKLEEIAIATPLLRLLGVCVIFVTLSSMSTAILQAIGKERVPVKAILVASVAKLAINYILIGIPSINIMGAPIGTTICYLVILLMNYHYINKYTDMKIKVFKIALKPLVSSVVMIAISSIFLYIFKTLLNSVAWGMLITIPIAVVIYFATLILVGGITKRDVEDFPGGGKIARVLRLK